MSSRLAFQTQLASIMEVLANAAVAEICKLVDDDYAVVSLQMSQCQRENKALKRKLHLLELKMARGNAERRLRESAINGGRPRIQISGGERLREVANTASASPTCTDGGFRGQMEVTLWSDRTAAGDPELIHTEHVQTKPAVQSPDVELVEAEAAQVKEENVEATLSRLTEAEEVLIRDDGVVEHLPRGSGQRPGLHQDTQSTSNQTPTTAPTLTPTLGSRRQRGSRGVEKTEDEDDVVLVKVEGMEEVGTETQSQTSLSIQEGLVESSTDDFRANLPFDDLTQSSTNQLSDLQENGQGLSESAESTPVMSHDLGSVVTVQLMVPDTVPDSERTRVRSTARTSARSDFSLFDLESFFTRWAPDSEPASAPGGPSCSFTNHDSAQSEQDQVIIVESEAQDGVQAPQEAAGRLSGVHQTRTQAVPSVPAPQRIQAPPPQPLWTRSSAVMRSAQAPGVRPAQTTAPSNPPSVSSKAASSSAQHRASFLSRHNKSLAVGMGPNDRRRKRYMCRACGKAFSGVSNLEAHERVHTGEKPFCCDTCGKRFSEAGNLKKHQRVHTGEKPFSCERCGKTFAWICNLRTHQQSATGCGAQGRPGAGLS
ncbi:zinc finger protein 853 isoform X2 [Cheilinus undulatus]|uniref:zinc finger protein 853 isoform X2 n=1 Tax=Cheilinus undulatus TaxID=241271 RepID=UPI001BD4070B|nr:zinc finger protein 853 isoform X2 [Cheilinus undulatus]